MTRLSTARACLSAHTRPTALPSNKLSIRTSVRNNYGTCVAGLAAISRYTARSSAAARFKQWHAHSAAARIVCKQQPGGADDADM